MSWRSRPRGRGRQWVWGGWPRPSWCCRASRCPLPPRPRPPSHLSQVSPRQYHLSCNNQTVFLWLKLTVRWPLQTRDASQLFSSFNSDRDFWANILCFWRRGRRTSLYWSIILLMMVARIWPMSAKTERVRGIPMMAYTMQNARPRREG